MDKSLKDNLRDEFKEILDRVEFKEIIEAQNIDEQLLFDAFNVLIDDIENEQQYTALQNKIINTLKSRSQS